MNEGLLLSILIASLDARNKQLASLLQNLQQQIQQCGAANMVEVLVRADDGTETIGAKRNHLIEQASGRFIVFVDDDDGVSEQYVSSLVQAIQGHPEADCICFPGEIYFRGKHPRLLVHSISFTQWCEQDGRYVRPPSHITPVLRSIASAYQFEETDYSEDIDWSLRMSQDGVLRQEAVVEQVLYFYYSRVFYAYQFLLDHTQTLRHALGLRLANRISARRALKKRSG